MRTITDDEIEEYLQERNVLPQYRINLREVKGHYRARFSITGDKGHRFKVDIRQNKRNPLDFSVILSIFIQNNPFILKRYNGNHPSPHFNKIEKEKITGFHIHEATQRYQEKGFYAECYAKPTQRYNDWKTALEIMFSDNNITKLDENQAQLT